MKKSFIIDGIILIFLALILCFVTLPSSDYFASDIVFSVIIGFAGVFLVISGVTGKVLFTGKELKTAPIKPKKIQRQKTFIVTGIIQAVVALLYSVPGIYAIFSPEITRDVLDAFGYLLVLLSFIIPVMPICFICNAVALISARDENGKGEKEGRKWLYIILSALVMITAWFFGLGPIAARF